MAWNTPSASDISALLRGALRRYLPGTDALVWPNNLTAIFKTFASGLYDMHLRAAWLYDQIFASTATVEHLEKRHAADYGIFRRPPARAVGNLSFIGVPDTIYPAGIRFLIGSNIYISSSDVRCNLDATVTFPVHSEKPGLAQNVAADQDVSRADPALFAGLATTGIVAHGGLGGGADIESDDALRDRVLDRKRRPPQGGAVSDYERFALEIPGVVKAWAWSFANGPGTIGLWFLFDGRTNLIPSISDVAVVQETIEARRLIRAEFVASAPIPTPIDITISGLGADTTETRSAIAASLTSMLFDRGRPGVAAEAFVLSRSWISEAISLAIGEDRHILSSPLADVVLTDGQYPVLGTISYE